MRVFILGLPGSCRTAVSKAIANEFGNYIDAMSWLRSTFRQPNSEEHPSRYEDAYQEYLSIRWLSNPSLITDHIQQEMQHENQTYIIDGLVSPRDFISLFDYREDVVVFLNRVDNNTDYQDYESIGVSVIRDYCFWMASSDLIAKPRWIEYNFKVPGEEDDYVKPMGAQNSLFIVRSPNKVISHLKEQLRALIK